MKIGDKVRFESKNNGTMIGIIIDNEIPRCKCKGMGRWVIDFNGEIKKIQIGIHGLNPYDINPKMGNIKHYF
jgi:hypothetical protein